MRNCVLNSRIETKGSTGFNRHRRSGGIGSSGEKTRGASSRMVNAECRKPFRGNGVEGWIELSVGSRAETVTDLERRWIAMLTSAGYKTTTLPADIRTCAGRSTDWSLW